MLSWSHLPAPWSVLISHFTLVQQVYSQTPSQCPLHPHPPCSPKQVSSFLHSSVLWFGSHHLFQDAFPDYPKHSRPLPPLCPSLELLNKHPAGVCHRKSPKPLLIWPQSSSPYSLQCHRFSPQLQIPAPNPSQPTLNAHNNPSIHLFL